MNDMILEGKPVGDVAARLMVPGAAENAYRTNAVLRHEEWINFDDVVVEIAQDRLIGVADLMSRGLVHRPGNGIGSTVLQYQDVSDMGPAQTSMDGLTRSNNERVIFTSKFLPLPIIHKDFQINERELIISRKMGDPLDVTQAALASRNVAELAEDTLFNGNGSYSFGGGTIFGYTDFPQRNAVTLTGEWDGLTGEQILKDVLNMKQASVDANHFGPYILYVPKNYETTLDDDFKADGDLTIRERIMAIKSIEDVQVSDRLSDSNVLLVEMSIETVRMVEALPLTVMQWDSEGPWLHHFKVLTINVPQIRADQSGQCGVTHGTVA